MMIAEQTDPKSARELFLWCGGLAAFLILGTRFGLLKDAPASPMTKRE